MDCVDCVGSGCGLRVWTRGCGFEVLGSRLWVRDCGFKVIEVVGSRLLVPGCGLEGRRGSYRLCSEIPGLGFGGVDLEVWIWRWVWMCSCYLSCGGIRVVCI